MANTKDDSSLPRWPNGACAALVLTIDNMGEAADLDRNLWPESAPIGYHFSVKEVIPQFLAILAKHDISATYFVESWNLSVYPSTIREIAGAGHEIGWHAWRHEAWSKIPDEAREKANFARSFGEEGLQGFINESKSGEATIDSYKGFRPPGGIIHGQRTLGICK
jgi:peptidoglycan/xylan/chitin deacetylase (PgdA/CDA1 family)